MQTTQTVPQTAEKKGPTTESQLKRVSLFLEEGNWKNADKYCDKVLDMEPECAQAYLGKLMAELKLSKVEAFRECFDPFEDRNNYQNALRFADAEFAETVTQCAEYGRKKREEVANILKQIDEDERKAKAEAEAKIASIPAPSPKQDDQRIEELTARRSKLDSELAGLGLFKRSEKKALTEQIRSISDEINKARQEAEQAQKRTQEEREKRVLSIIDDLNAKLRICGDRRLHYNRNTSILRFNRNLKHQKMKKLLPKL